MRITKRRLGLAIAGGAILCIAAASAGYAIRTAVVDQGGQYAASSSYRIRPSVGGAVAGNAQSTSYRIRVNAISAAENAPAPGPPPGPAPDPESTSLTGGGCAPAGAGAPLACALAVLALRAASRIPPRRAAGGGDRACRPWEGPA